MSLESTRREITLVCSVHRENGLCNVAELLNILTALRPEVIFEEVRPIDFDDYCKQAPLLEAEALRQYTASAPLRRVAVDRYEMTEVIAGKSAFDRVADYVSRNNPEYESLEEQDLENVYTYGYRYLNSSAFSTLRARIFRLEDETVVRSGDMTLLHALRRWRAVLKSRDEAMVQNICEYTKANSFKGGVFLVGAAHKLGVVEQVKLQAAVHPAHVEWQLGSGGAV